MNRRNWLELERKLVDKYDLDYELQGIQAYLGEQALSFFGEGVLITATYPTPFPITMSGVAMTGQVGPGIAYDPNGQISRIDGSSPTSKIFTILPAASQPRWDLLVLRYKQTGDTLVPKPSDPISSIYLNLHDDFQLVVIAGTPSGTPAYPAKGSKDVILAGLQVSPSNLVGTDVFVDLAVRELAVPDVPKFPVIVQEIPAGAVDGTNASFTLSKTPLNASSTIVILDGPVEQLGNWSLAGNVITFVTPPSPGQGPYVWYIAGVASSTNPLAGQQEIPSGTRDGSNLTFGLAGRPADRSSMIVWVDGLVENSANWTLIQGPSGSQLVFTAGNAPAAGQSLYCFYLANPATVGSGIGGGGGSGVQSLNGLTGVIGLVAGTGVTVTPSGLNLVIAAPGSSGGYISHGTQMAPMVIDPAVGVPANSSQQRALWLVESQGGQQTITAVPQIAPGSTIGQELLLMGVSDTDYLTLQDGNGCNLNGPANLKANASILLFWSGSAWNEASRR